MPGARRRDTGETVYPGWPVGSEAPEGAGGWQTYWANPARPEEPQRVDYFRHWVFNDPGWNWWSFDWAKGVDIARARMAPLVDAVSPDLSAFERRGGKIILYQGWADPVVSAADTIAYYEHVSAATPRAAPSAPFSWCRAWAIAPAAPGAAGFLLRRPTHPAISRWRCRTGLKRAPKPSPYPGSASSNAAGSERGILLAAALCLAATGALQWKRRRQRRRQLHLPLDAGPHRYSGDRRSCWPRSCSTGCRPSRP